MWLRYIVLFGLAIFDYTNVQQLTNTSLALESRKQNMWPKYVGDHVFISPLTTGRFVSCRYKNAMYRGDPNLYKTPVLDRPGFTSLGFPVCTEIEALFTKSSSTPLKAKFHWRWSFLKICFFFLVIKGPCLSKTGGVVLSSYVFNICITQGLYNKP